MADFALGAAVRFGGRFDGRVEGRTREGLPRYDVRLDGDGRILRGVRGGDLEGLPGGLAYRGAPAPPGGWRAMRDDDAPRRFRRQRV